MELHPRPPHIELRSLGHRTGCQRVEVEEDRIVNDARPFADHQIDGEDLLRANPLGMRLHCLQHIGHDG